MPITFNQENFRKVLDHIKANPKTWEQSKWHCGTSHCFAGHAQIMSGKPANNATVRQDARGWLGLTMHEANYLFAASRSIEDFEAAAIGVYNRDGYDRAGYNRDGYDRAGYNRDGYNRAGYDRDGLDADNNPRPVA